MLWHTEAMRELARILDYSLPKPPPGLLLADTLQPIWALCCPPSLQRVTPLSYCRGRLFVAVPGSAFAARLRQDMGDVLGRLRQAEGLSDLREIVVRIVESESRRPAIGHKIMKQEYPLATQCLAILSSDMSDPALKESLARLSGTLLAMGHPKITL